MNKITLKKSVMQAHLVQGSLPEVGQTQPTASKPDMGLIKSSDVRISLAQPSCPTWYRCRLELALTSCRHPPGASVAYRKQTRQSYCTINLQQEILQTYKISPQSFSLQNQRA